MREAVGNYGKNLAVSRRIHACWCGARICVLLGLSVDRHAALMLPALALRLALADPFRGLVAAIRIGCHHADRLFACG